MYDLETLPIIYAHEFAMGFLSPGGSGCRRPRISPYCVQEGDIPVLRSGEESSLETVAHFEVCFDPETGEISFR
jgi:hypothetical protein